MHSPSPLHPPNYSVKQIGTQSVLFAEQEIETKCPLYESNTQLVHHTGHSPAFSELLSIVCSSAFGLGDRD